jgi:phenylacetate-coenzyme A ligase PaaK-like adenylate-forming protein
MNARDPATANPLDAWTAAHFGLPANGLTRDAIVAAQLARLRETVAWAQERSPFYRRQLAGIDASAIESLDDLQRLPFTTADDLRRNDPPLLCVSQSKISRVVTLETSGTSGPPKRLFFTAADQEATLDFFHHGMSLPARPGDRVMIMFPGERPGSVGDLLGQALRRLGAEPILAGWPADPAAAADLVRRERPDVVVGAPVPMLAVARHSAAAGAPHVRSVLLSSDHAADSLRRSLAALWGCEVFEHYGMTEMGLGGGVDCHSHMGYHLRESELLVEIVDPVSGTPLPAGAAGEVVFTTLARRGLPLVRYRTGDRARLMPGTCACGSPLLRLDRIQGRIGGRLRVGGAELDMAELDEALFGVPGVIDFAATLRRETPPTLRLEISHLGVLLPEGLRSALSRLSAARGGRFRIELASAPDGRLLPRSGKRRIALEAA